MPQGGIDEGEDPRNAALRELYEETGIRTVTMIAEMPGWLTYDLPAELLGKAWGGRYRGQKQKWFADRFIGDDSEISITPPPATKPSSTRGVGAARRAAEPDRALQARRLPAGRRGLCRPMPSPARQFGDRPILKFNKSTT